MYFVNLKIDHINNPTHPTDEGDDMFDSSSRGEVGRGDGRHAGRRTLAIIFST